jgi:hypothetical protein
MSDVTLDACVLRSAGLSSSDRSVAAREVLDAVISERRQVVFDVRLMEEWRKHASTYGERWLAAVETKGMLVPVSISERQFAAIQAASKYLDASNYVCAMKDAHLVVTALCYFTILVSDERRSRGVFTKLARRLDCIGEVCWVSASDSARIREVIGRRMRAPCEWFLVHAT